MPAMTTNPAPVRRREIFGWAMFDFANSSYTTIIITLLFSIYFTKIVAGTDNADFLWGFLGIGLTNLIVLLTSPILGAIADDSGRKKVLLFATYILCVGGTASLYLVLPGQVVAALILLIVSNIAFSYGENLAGAFLPEISTPRNIGRISAFGWGLGYFGGLACLFAVQPLVGGLSLPRADLIADPGALGHLRLAWLATAGFFLLAGLPTFLLLKERAPRGPKRGLLGYARVGFSRLGETFHAIGRFRELRRFLTVFFCYQCGLTSIIAFAGIVAERTFHFDTAQLITLFIALQLSSAGGAFLFGWIQDRIGGRRTIQITLVMWIGICIGAYLAVSKGQFWVIALLAGLGIGSLQAASRAMVGLFAPPEKSAEFFGFWGLAGKAAYFVGPAVFGWISSASGSQRVAFLATLGFFVVGLLGMQWIDEQRGHAEAEAWHAERGGDRSGDAAPG
jgi:UMF1 family MFS transporter